ncbi:MAG: DUF1577 domain-containing protein [Leptospirales bacterium]|nr:DUF1577 domain-containing protein [Leptospirales bacterium]
MVTAGASKLDVLLEKDREWDFVKEKDRILFVLRERLQAARFYLKHTDPPAEFYRGEASGEGFIFHCSPELELDGRITLYTTQKRQIEIDFEVGAKPEPGAVELTPVEARIGKIERSYPRALISNGAIHAANFQISKSEITVDPTRPQVANKVVYAEFERQLGQHIPGIKIYEFAQKDRPDETLLLNKKTEGIFIAETGDTESWRGRAPGCLDYFALLEDEEKGLADRKRRQYTDRSIQSLLALPILYEMPDGRQQPIAFFYCETRRGLAALTPAAVSRLQDANKDIIDRIEDANLITVKDKQTVVNISEGGVALELTNAELLKYLPHRRTVTFDLVFRMQAPLRFRGAVCHIHRSTPQSMVVGVNLEGSGHSDFRKGVRERLKSLVSMLKG